MEGLRNSVAALFTGSLISSAISGWSLLQLYSIALSSDYVLISFAMVVNGVAPFLDFGISRFNIRQVTFSDKNNEGSLLSDWLSLAFVLSCAVGVLSFVVSFGYTNFITSTNTSNPVVTGIYTGIIGVLSLFISALRSISEFKGKFALISLQRILLSFGLLGMYFIYRLYSDINLALLIFITFRLLNLMWYSIILRIVPRFEMNLYNSIMKMLKIKDLFWITGCNILYFMFVMMERFYSAHYFSNSENASYVFVLEIIGFLFIAASSFNSVLYPYFSRGLGRKWSTSRLNTILISFNGLIVMIVLLFLDLGEVTILRKNINMNLVGVGATGAIFNIIAGVKLSILNARGDFRAPFIFNLIQFLVILILIVTIGHVSLEIFAFLFAFRYLIDYTMLSLHYK